MFTAKNLRFIQGRRRRGRGSTYKIVIKNTTLDLG